MATWKTEHHKQFLWWLRDWESTNGEELSNRPFVNSDDRVNDAIAAIANRFGVFYSTEQMRDLSVSVHRLPAWKLTPEELEDDKDRRNANLRNWGTPGGLDAIDKRNATAAEKFRRFSPQYVEYINGPVWRERASRYLRERATRGDLFICELCGYGHVARSMVNVHHNTYTQLNGQEPDEHLCCVCADRCHDLATIAYYARRGKLNVEMINDQLRPLLQLIDEGGQ